MMRLNELAKPLHARATSKLLLKLETETPGSSDRAPITPRCPGSSLVVTGV
jgi:hypothetical protein